MIKKRNSASGKLTARFHTAKFPTCEKELKKSLKSSVVAHTFNPSTPEAEAGRSLSLRPAWSTEQVLGQPSLDNEGNHRKQKDGEDEIEQGVMFQP